MSRQYVYLSEDIETAKMVGKRKDSDSVILYIDTSNAVKAGVKFYRANDKVWLCKQLPPQFIK